MPKMNCAVMNCSNSTYRLKKWNQEICYEHNVIDNICKREDCIHCIPPFKLYCFPSILRNAELRNKWIRALKRQNKNKTEWKPSESNRVCSIHFVGSAYETNSVPTLNLGCEVEEKKYLDVLTLTLKIIVIILPTDQPEVILPTARTTKK